MLTQLPITQGIFIIMLTLKGRLASITIPWNKWLGQPGRPFSVFI